MPQVDIWQALLAKTPLSKSVQTHVSRVYQTLCVLVATCAVGVVAHAKYQFGGFLTAIGVIAAAIALAFTPYRSNDSSNESKRIWMAIALAFFVGASISPGLSMVVDEHGEGYVIHPV